MEEENYFKSSSDLLSEDGKDEGAQENFQNEEHESENEQLDRLEIENSAISDEDNFTEGRPPPEPPPDQSLTSA